MEKTQGVGGGGDTPLATYDDDSTKHIRTQDSLPVDGPQNRQVASRQLRVLLTPLLLMMMKRVQLVSLRDAEGAQVVGLHPPAIPWLLERQSGETFEAIVPGNKYVPV